jgi:hypothetical protein
MQEAGVTQIDAFVARTITMTTTAGSMTASTGCDGAGALRHQLAERGKYATESQLRIEFPFADTSDLNDGYDLEPLAA